MSNYYELEGNDGLVKDENRINPGVLSGDSVVAGSSEEVKNGDGFGDRYGVRSLQGDALDTSGEVAPAGVSDERLSTCSIEVEETRVSMEVDNGALEGEKARASDSSVNSSKHGRSEVRICENGISKHVEPSHRGEKANFTVKGHGGWTPAETDAKIDVQNRKNENSGSKRGKDDLEVKRTMSQYDSMLYMFDDFAANRRGGTVGSKLIGYGYEIGDMVWGKVKSHPWWPGHIYNETFALPAVHRTKSEGHVLVAFFGDSSYGWFDPAELIPFDVNFAEKSKQINSKTFMKAVEEAVDEVSRRSGLALACRCRNPFNFRPTNVKGFFSVDVGDYEAGAVYSVNQINKARDSFQPREILSFVKRVSRATISADYGSIQYIRSKATILAYRKAIFEEFDETYAQAFGVKPVRPTKPTEAPPPIVTSRALSGPLVIAEDLGKRKNSVKEHKMKDEAKKNKYLFRRRDESNETKTNQFNQGQASSFTRVVRLEGSAASSSGGYVLQTRAPVVSVKPEMAEKHEAMEITAGNNALSQDVNDQAVAPPVVNSGTSESSVSYPVGQLPGYSSHLKGVKSSYEGKDGLRDVKTSNSGAQLGSSCMDGSSSVHEQAYPVVVDNMPHDYGTSSVEGIQRSSSQQVTGEGLGELEQSRDDYVRTHLSDPSNVELHGNGSRMQTGSGPKKVKVHKRPAEEMGTNSVLMEKKKKKKRKKEMTMQMSSDHMQKHSEGCGVKKAGKPVHINLPSSEGSLVNYPKKGDKASSLPLPDAVGSHQDLPELLSDLHALALNPFHGAERRNPALMKNVILRFRSHVFQKSLSSLLPAENDSDELPAIKSSAVATPSNSLPIDGVGDSSSLKSSRPPPVRSDDPTKGGTIRGPSDRQEEIAAKKLKKINDLKSLKAEKKNTCAQKDLKDTVAQAPPKKAVKLESTKKMAPPPRVSEPTMLVMKFPPQGTLPSINELKARFARFGPLDHPATRAFWKSSTCRVVFLYKSDAQAAYRFAAGSNSLFGNANVRCYMRDLGAPSNEPESLKVQREDASGGNLKLRNSAAEVRPPTAIATQPPQQPIQLKSCLKRSSGDEGGIVIGGNGGGRGTPRVKFMLGGEESGRKEQLMVGNKNNDTSFLDGGAYSSHGMDYNSKNFQNIPSASSMAPSQYPKAPTNLPSTGVVPRNDENFNTPTITSTSLPTYGAPTNIDIRQQMLGLLTKCNDIVANVSGLLGYVPYQPL